MEFGYTEEQERFRKELNDWLDANIPADMEFPAELEELDEKTYAFAKELRRKLAEKGWLHPSYPKEYGGAELSYDELVVYQEVFSRRTVPPVYDLSHVAGAGLFALGTEEQKKKWLPLIGRGEIITWESFTEPEAGTDLANVQTRAIRQDNGDFLLNGQKIYSGDGHPADYLYTLAIDPKLPRHQNMSAFMVKADSPGISYEPLQPIVSSRKNVIYFEDVHVPAENLVGEVINGWAVAQASLAGERGGTFFLVTYSLSDQLVEYCKKAKRNGRRLADDPHVRELLTDLFIEAKADRLLLARTFWKGSHGIRTFYEGSQNILNWKVFNPKLGETVLEIFGPSALITAPKWTILGGRIERQMRFSLQTHGAGTPEAQKIVISRLLGLPSARR